MRHLAGVVLLAAGLCGCGVSPRLKPLTEGALVLAFGDSLTSGVGAEEGESYPAVLAGLLRCSVVNAGVAGELSSEGLARLPFLLRRHKPALVIICHGGNDMLRKLDDQLISRNLRAMVNLSKESGADVVLLGVPKPGLFLRAPAFYAEVAKECRVAYEAKVLSDILSTPTQKSDMIHPDADGYRQLAERIATLIRKQS